MSKKPVDRVAEAYHGLMGEDFSRKTRNRINWIVNHAKGTSILDVGCSQGIVPIILGREGKQVDGIDLNEESIDYANQDLAKEHDTVQKNVHFRVANFMTDEQLKPAYDAILLTEVLEHIADPLSFLEKVYRHLKIDGRLVVTVPFGINDYFDHKRSYYFLDLFDQLSTHFTIEKFDYLGNWVGVICEKTAENLHVSPKSNFSRETISELEKAFHTVEQELRTRITSFQGNIQQKNAYINELKQQHTNTISTHKAEKERLLEKITQQNDQIGKQYEKHQQDDRQLRERYEEQLRQKDEKIYELTHGWFETKNTLERYKLENENSQKLLVELKAELLESLHNEEKALNDYLSEKEKHRNLINKLNEQIRKLEQKYLALKKSKLGALTLKYWGLRQGLAKKKIRSH